MDRMTIESGNSSQSKNLTIAVIILFLLLTGLYLGIIFGLVKKDKVDYQECNKPQGEFAVEPGTTYNSFVYGCNTDYDDTDVCRFTKVSNLTDAVNICNQNADKCNRFVYNPGNQILSFIPLNSSPSPDNVNENSYTRQVGITFKTKGPTISS